jgi:hypothetical protein
MSARVKEITQRRNDAKRRRKYSSPVVHAALRDLCFWPSPTVVQHSKNSGRVSMSSVITCGLSQDKLAHASDPLQQLEFTPFCGQKVKPV